MTSLPTRESILDDSIVTSDWKTYYGDIRDYISLLPFAQVSSQVTIVDNAITVSNSANKVLASNNSPVTVDNIKTEGLQDSQILLLYKGDEQHNISLKNGGIGDGSISTLENKDVTLSMDFPIILERDGNNWKQIDLIGGWRATDDDINDGTSDIKFPTISQVKPFMGRSITAQLGVIVYSMKPTEGGLECNDEEHQGIVYKTLYAAIVDGTLPSVSYEEYQSQVSSKGFCDKFALDSGNKKFKCPNLSSVKLGKTEYKAYVGAWNTAEKNIVELQGILDQCLVVQTQVNEKGEEIVAYVNQSLQDLADLRDSSIQSINQSKTSSLNEIESQETTSIANIEQKRLDSVNSVEAKRLEIVSVGQEEIDKLNSLSTSLTNSFNTNASQKTQAFNTNAQEKQAQVNASANAAAQSAQTASGSADLAESWAIGDKSSRPEGSAQYWAEQASKGQKQADWNQTDNTQVDFIKNKPNLTVYQTKANISQTVDSSTTKYPSNKAVVNYSAKRHQVVSVLPVNPIADTFYYIPEE